MPVRAGSNDGVHGVLGNVKDLGHLVSLLKPYFLPASLAAPPHFTPTAAPATITPGSRATVVTSGSLTLEQLADVRVASPANGQVLTYVAAIAGWENLPVMAVTAVTASAPLASSGGNTPNISLTGLVPILNGGTGTATPALVAGANITITGAWPNQTINAPGATGGTITSVTATAPLTSTGGGTPNIALTTPLAIGYGGTGSATQNFVDLSTDQTIGGNKTFSDAVQSPNGFTAGPSAYYPYGCYINGGINVATSLSAASASFTTPLPIASGGTATATPALVAGTNVTISGTWPNQTISSSNPGGTVTSVTASGALASSGGTMPNITLTAPLSVANGGTGSTSQNFVDLTTVQAIAGIKTFSAAPVSANGFTSASSSYGPTSATVNGTLQATGLVSGPGPLLAAGDIQCARSAITGGVEFGSGSGAGLLYYDGTNYNFFTAGPTAVSAFITAATGAYNFSSTATISSGTAVPTAANVAGSLYLRATGAAGARIYVGQGGSSWVAIGTV